MRVFGKAGVENTREALRIGIARAMEMGTDVVLSTNTGASAAAAVEIGRECGFTGRIVAVTHVYGFVRPGMNELEDGERARLRGEGVVFVTAAHALSGAERGMSGKFGGTYPVEIVAHTLRMMGQGTKVCVEVAAMALDAGCVAAGKPVVALGGTGRGLDTAVVVTPGYSARVFETRVHEFLCKPE